MNNTFDFTRFKKVLARDFRATYSRFGLAMLILILVDVTVWMLCLAGRLGTDSDSLGHCFVYDPTLSFRISCLSNVIIIAFAIAPSIIYRSCNLKGRGNYYAMLPASHLEKYLSMFLYCCIFAPIVVFLGSLLVDILLTLLPFGNFKSFIWHELADYDSKFKIIFITFLFLTSSIFMFTNTLFKRAKFIKTVLWLMLIGFVLLISNLTFPALFRLIDSFWPVFIIMIIISLILQSLTYYRLRDMQY